MTPPPRPRPTKLRFKPAQRRPRHRPSRKLPEANRRALLPSLSRLPPQAQRTQLPAMTRSSQPFTLSSRNVQCPNRQKRALRPRVSQRPLRRTRVKPSKRPVRQHLRLVQSPPVPPNLARQRQPKRPHPPHPVMKCSWLRVSMSYRAISRQPWLRAAVIRSSPQQHERPSPLQLRRPTGRLPSRPPTDLPPSSRHRVRVKCHRPKHPRRHRNGHYLPNAHSHKNSRTRQNLPPPLRRRRNRKSPLQQALRLTIAP